MSRDHFERITLQSIHLKPFHHSNSVTALILAFLTLGHTGTMSQRSTQTLMEGQFCDGGDEDEDEEDELQLHDV